MSRRVNESVSVEADSAGVPLSVAGLPVSLCLDHYRMWVGVLQGEPQVDVWTVETPRGICELHFRCCPTGNEETLDGAWLLARWED